MKPTSYCDHHQRHHVKLWTTCGYMVLVVVGHGGRVLDNQNKQIMTWNEMLDRYEPKMIVRK